jgi:hypothetical protein
MKQKLQGLLFLVVIVGVFAAFQFWAVKAREREWWWFNGGPDHMAFADLKKSDKFTGHILLVERMPTDAPATEFDVKWSCAPQQIAWGDAWTRNQDFDQIDRSPAPRDLRKIHAAKDPMESQFLKLACSSTRQVPLVFKLRADRSPIELAQDAFKLVAGGVAPPAALRRSTIMKDGE